MVPNLTNARKISKKELNRISEFQRASQEGNEQLSTLEPDLGDLVSRLGFRQTKNPYSSAENGARNTGLVREDAEAQSRGLY